MIMISFNQYLSLTFFVWSWWFPFGFFSSQMCSLCFPSSSWYCLMLSTCLLSLSVWKLLFIAIPLSHALVACVSLVWVVLLHVCHLPQPRYPHLMNTNHSFSAECFSGIQVEITHLISIHLRPVCPTTLADLFCMLSLSLRCIVREGNWVVCAALKCCHPTRKSSWSFRTVEDVKNW